MISFIRNPVQHVQYDHLRPKWVVLMLDPGSFHKFMMKKREKQNFSSLFKCRSIVLNSSYIRYQKSQFLQDWIFRKKYKKIWSFLCALNFIFSFAGQNDYFSVVTSLVEDPIPVFYSTTFLS